MNVLIIAKSCYRLPTSQGGSDTAALRSATLLATRGHRVTLIGLGNIGSESEPIRFVSVPARVDIRSRYSGFYFFKGFVLACMSLMEAVKVLGRKDAAIDVVHTHTSVSVPVLKFRFRNLPIIYTVHDPLYLRSRGARGVESLARIFNNNLLERVAFRYASHILAVSDSIAGQIRALGVSQQKITTLYPLSAPGPGSTNTGRGRLPSSVKRPYVLSVGAQMGRKRFDYLIGALPMVDSVIHLVLVGNGSDREKLVAEAKSVGVSERVMFIDSTDSQTLNELYGQAFLYVLISEREGFPATVREALQNGTPTIYITPDSRSMISPLGTRYLRTMDFNSIRLIPQLIKDAYLEWMSGQLDRNEIRRWSLTAFPTAEASMAQLEAVYKNALSLPNSIPST